VSQDEDENDRGDDDDDTSLSPPLYVTDPASLGDEPIVPGMSGGDGGDIGVSTDSFEPSSSAADDDDEMTGEHSV